MTVSEWNCGGGGAAAVGEVLSLQVMEVLTQVRYETWNIALKP